VQDNMFVEIGCKIFEINHIVYNKQEIWQDNNIIFILTLSTLYFYFY
jgi:hypothetical protein